MQKFLKNLFTAQRCRRAMFFLLFAAVMLLNSSPELRADALYLIADGDTVSVLDGTTDIPQERVIVAGAQSGDAEVTLPAGEKVTVTHGDDIEYATTRNGERVSELLRRLQISVSPLEMVLVDVTEEEVEITVASDFTYYETATEAAPHTTLTSTSYRIPKGETQIVQQGIDGTRDIVYEVLPGTLVGSYLHGRRGRRRTTPPSRRSPTPARSSTRRRAATRSSPLSPRATAAAIF